MKLTDFKALTFDCYGTLIDWESGMIKGLEPLLSKVERKLSRNEILQAHARHESTQQTWTPGTRYSELLAIVYKCLAEAWGVAVTPDECAAYGQSIKQWPAFSDSPDALQYLKKHYKLVILSNVDNDSFKYSNDRLGVEFDAIYTAEDIGSYKPADRNFKYMLEHLKSLGIEKSDILHTAESLYHDHIPAKKNGLASCWIYRRSNEEGFGATIDPGEIPNYNFQFNSMADLVKAHQEAFSQGDTP